MLLGFKTPYTTNQLEITNNSFSVFSFETACFESFGNGSFPISKEEEHNESYIKFSNDNIISKIKSKLNSSLQLSKQNPPLKISDSPINKSLNEISFDMEHSMIKNNSVKFLVERREAKPPLAKKNLSQFVNRNKVPKKASTSCEFRKSKVHLSDSSITSDTTSLSSKRNYRQNSTGNIFKRKMITEQNINDDAMKRTKMFYKNIKNIKSKYGDLIKSNNLTVKASSFKGIKLDQYINAKLSDMKNV